MNSLKKRVAILTYLTPLPDLILWRLKDEQNKAPSLRLTSYLKSITNSFVISNPILLIVQTEQQHEKVVWVMAKKKVITALDALLILTDWASLHHGA